jgi:2-polyprenyl-3-methyl-5-hydroxy-6-metoxy-1,4-benzoquinol methylase
LTQGYRSYRFTSADACAVHQYLEPHVFALAEPIISGARVLDVGCGNGWLASRFQERGCQVVGIDLSQYGIRIAREAFPDIRFEVLEANDRILAALGEQPFDLVVSTEVIEHLYDPRSFARGCFQAVRPGGRIVISTPYHGFLKNLSISLAGKWDSHANPAVGRRAY